MKYANVFKCMKLKLELSKRWVLQMWLNHQPHVYGFSCFSTQLRFDPKAFNFMYFLDICVFGVPAHQNGLPFRYWMQSKTRMWWDLVSLKARNVILKSGTITKRLQRQVGSTKDTFKLSIKPLCNAPGSFAESGKSVCGLQCCSSAAVSVWKHFGLWMPKCGFWWLAATVTDSVGLGDPIRRRETHSHMRDILYRFSTILCRNCWRKTATNVNKPSEKPWLVPKNSITLFVFGDVVIKFKLTTMIFYPP